MASETAVRPARTLEYLRTKLRDVSLAPVMQLIGFRLTEVEEGAATVELDAGPQHANPMGTLHGGILCDIADAAMGLADLAIYEGRYSDAVAILEKSAAADLAARRPCR